MYVTTVCTYVFVPPESLSQHIVSNFLHNHHNSNDVPKVYIPSTMIETCTILQSLSSENVYMHTFNICNYVF